MTRMLIWPLSAGPIMVTATIATVCAAVTLTAGCSARAASARDPKFQTSVGRTVRYLQNAQQENGGFAEPGTQPGSDFTAWVALALAAAGINPRDQTTAKQHWVGGHSAYTYLAEGAAKNLTYESSQHKIPTTEFERELLVVDASGASPHDFGGVDLVDKILKRQITTGSNEGAFPHEVGEEMPGVNDTIFAILALSPVHEPATEHAVRIAVDWLEAQQKCDGSWSWEYASRTNPCPSEERRLLPGEQRGEVDMTGAALQALNATKHPDGEGQERAFAYLHEAENLDGGFPEFLAKTEAMREESNVASTAWVVQAMWSAGQNPEDWVLKGSISEPLGYLASLQQEDGHIRYKASEELNGMWMTAYAAPAFFGDPWPIPEAPYEELPALPPEEPASGNGGVSTNPGGGVTAGGGGKGARLFSRPQPKSRGHTPGGARQPKPQKHEQPPTHKLNPGRARKKPTPTLTIEKHVHHVHRSSVRAGHGNGGGDGGEPVVKGILLGSASNASYDSALEPGAPGLRSAGAGGKETGWPTIGITIALVLSVLAGMRIEHRCREVTL